ncbi:MFS transporter [Planosporangium thailandense]|uniref:MFS transporter n=1 Tax=Planosporangium thailandense TaxID=765197 RepID=A0ABX0Y726_9ACTN|nr:MFS transporter [Planosporangium thailandense]NJC73104.1 MFS transporter [Planosporangium thailandense]
MTDVVQEADTAGNRNGVRLRSAFLVSSAGDWIYRFAVPTLILTITGSAMSTAIAYVIEFIPYIVVGLFAGVVADRVNRRRVLIACDVTSFVIALAIAGFAALEHPPVAALYGCAFLLACVRPFYFPAFQGFLVDVTPERKLSRINAWTQTIDSTLGFLGPIIGTALIAELGVPLAALVNALSFALSALLIYQISYVVAGAGATGEGQLGAALAGVGRDFVAGLHTVWRIRPIWWGTLLMAAANLAGYVVEGNLVYLLLTAERLPKIALGLVFSAHGLGAVAGAVLAPRLIDRYPTGRLLAAGMGLSAVAMALPAVIPHYGAIIVGWGIEGIATSVIVVSWFTARQKIVAADMIGRVVSVSRAVAYVAIPLGAVLGGALAAQTSPVRLLFLCAALLQAAVFVGTAVSPVGRIDSAVPAPASDPHSPALP